MSEAPSPLAPGEERSGKRGALPESSLESSGSAGELDQNPSPPVRNLRVDYDSGKYIEATLVNLAPGHRDRFFPEVPRFSASRAPHRPPRLERLSGVRSPRAGDVPPNPRRPPEPHRRCEPVPSSRRESGPREEPETPGQ